MIILDLQERPEAVEGLGSWGVGELAVESNDVARGVVYSIYTYHIIYIHILHARTHTHRDI